MADGAHKRREAAHHPEEPKKDEGRSWKSWFSVTNPDLWILLSVVVGVCVLGWYFGNTIFSLFTNAKRWFQDELPYSLVVYYLIFCACAIVLIPYGPFCIAIGFIFGLGWGLVIQMLAIFMSAALLFGIGRHVFKEKVDEFISKSEGSRAWKGLMKYMRRDWKEAAKINVLLCFMPVPYGSHPYLFALSEVPFEQFVVFFMLGMLPNTILNLLIGEALAEASMGPHVDTYHFIGTAVAIVAIVIAVWYASTIAQQVLEEDDTEDPPTEKDRLIP